MRHSACILQKINLRRDWVGEPSVHRPIFRALQGIDSTAASSMRSDQSERGAFRLQLQSPPRRSNHFERKRRFLVSFERTYTHETRRALFTLSFQTDIFFSDHGDILAETLLRFQSSVMVLSRCSASESVNFGAFVGHCYVLKQETSDF